MKRCINCKQDILDFGAGGLGEFLPDLPPKSLATATELAIYDRAYGDLRGAAYPFVREGEEGCFWHLRLQRSFAEGRILLRVDDVFTSYLRHDWSIAQCTHKVANNARYTRLGTVPERASVTSPWFTAENHRPGLLSALEQLGDWYRQSHEAIAAACRKQQGWVDKELGRDHRLARLYLRDRWQEADRQAVLALYRRVDEIAEEYNAAKARGEFSLGDPQGSFGRWFRGRLPAPFDRWEEELAAILQRKKNRVSGVGDPEYAHLFAVTNLLYMVHDLEKDRCPDILLAEGWRTGEQGAE